MYRGRGHWEGGWVWGGEHRRGYCRLFFPINPIPGSDTGTSQKVLQMHSKALPRALCPVLVLGGSVFSLWDSPGPEVPRGCRLEA